MRRHALALLAALAACEGPMGPPGPAGGAPSLDAGPPLDASADARVSVDASDDAAARDGGDARLTGHVRDPSGAPLGTGAVVLVPAARVAQLAGTPIDLTSSGAAAALARNDEPLEDLIASEPDLARAVVDGAGNFVFAAVPDGASFVVYVPAPEDALHLPGGQLARTPFAAEALRGSHLELRVSGTPSASARYVGSSACVNCHARHTLFASAHALTLRVPGVSAPQQDTASAPRIDEALAAFAADTTLYFSDCDPMRVDSATCRVSTSLPAAPSSVRLAVRLARDLGVPRDALGRYYVELSTDVASAQRYPVALTLGGSRTLQQFVTVSPLPDGGFTHFVLPFGYQLAGDDTRPLREDQRWIAYRVDDWLELAGSALHAPSHERAFERECVGCHATGFAARGDAGVGFRGSAAAEPNGSYDLDGDGRKELLAVGCEACHGPGSEHLEQLPRGQRIVSPSLLTPERQNLVCGSCHARQRGQHGELAPLDDALRMPRPGLSRSEYLRRHVSQVEPPDAVFRSGDARLSFAQYNEFLRSPKYRSGQLLVTCSDCHDAHASSGNGSDLSLASGDASCGGCHRAQREVLPHVAASLLFSHNRATDPAQLTCTQCHMVKTGRSGARVPALADITDSDPARHQQYWHGDRASHRFVFTDRSFAAEQPVAATLRCAPCHGEFLPVQ